MLDIYNEYQNKFNSDHMRLFYSDLLSILVKNHGTNIASEFVKEPKVADQRLYQSIIIQAFEDCLYTMGGKNEAYYKKDAHEWFINKEKILRISLC